MTWSGTSLLPRRLRLGDELAAVIAVLAVSLAMVFDAGVTTEKRGCPAFCGKGDAWVVRARVKSPKIEGFD